MNLKLNYNNVHERTTAVLYLRNPILGFAREQDGVGMSTARPTGGVAVVMVKEAIFRRHLAHDQY